MAYKELGFIFTLPVDGGVLSIKFCVLNRQQKTLSIVGFFSEPSVLHT